MVSHTAETARRTTASLKLVLLALLAMAATLAWATHARASILAQPGVNVTNQQIHDSLIANGATESLATAGANLSSNIEDRSGALGIYNGTCCTGVLQVNQTNLAAYCRCTSAQYAAMSLDQQTAIWLKLTNDGMNAGPLRQLSNMTTFDGQPVDDAMKLACVQLGTGNCQRMLASGSCSGFRDSNGTSVCSMASAIRNGSTNIGNTLGQGAGTGAGAGNVQDAPSASSLTMALGKPAYCWSCDVIVYAMGFTEAVTTLGLPVVFGDLRPLLLILLGIGFVNALAMAFIKGESPLRPIRALFPRLMLAVFLIGIGGAVITPIVIGDMMTQSLTMGADLGNSLASSAATALNINLDNTSASGTTNGGGNDCIYASAATVQLNVLIPAEQNILRLACTIHHAATTQLQIAIFLMNADNSSIWSFSSMAYNALFVLVGGVMAATTMLTMLRYGLTIMDMMVTMAVFVVMTPYVIFAWVFPSTKRTASKYLKLFVHAILLLTFSGIAAVVAILMMLTSIQFGLGQAPSGIPDPDQLLIAAQQYIRNLNMTDPSAVGKSALLAFGCLGGSMVAHRILAAMPALTSKVTGIKVPTALSAAAIGAVTGFARAAMGGGTVAATGLIQPAAAVAGRVAGRAFGR